jgi:hypothetical protein
MRKASLLLAAIAMLKLLAGTGWADTVLFWDSFGGYQENKCWTDGQFFGPWTVAWSGFGCVEAITDSSGTTWLNETPKAATSGSTGHSALTIGPSPGPVTSYTLQVSLKTIAQLDKIQKSWQVGWVLWSYTNPNSFYNIILKPNGWELDKEYTTSTGAQGQCYLATGSQPKFPIGVRYDLQITDTIVGAATKTITVKVSGGSLPGQVTVVTYTDAGACGVAPYGVAPDPPGNIALYDEAASVDFTNVQITTP